jgi:hypothetical protein
MVFLDAASVGNLANAPWTLFVVFEYHLPEVMSVFTKEQPLLVITRRMMKRMTARRRTTR